MPEYQLYCFAQSGNAYRVALMLNQPASRRDPPKHEQLQGQFEVWVRGADLSPPHLRKNRR